MKRKLPSSPIIVLICRFFALTGLFFLTRLIFYWFNQETFPGFTSTIFWQGLRFDAAAICILNAPYFLLLLLPFRFIESRTFRTIGNVYFLTVNSIALLTNLIDTCYFPFSMRRMTGDIFSFIGETNNFGDLLPVFFHNYWYIGAIWLGLIGLLFLTAYFTEKTDYHRLIRFVKLISWGFEYAMWLLFDLLDRLDNLLNKRKKSNADDVDALKRADGIKYAEKPYGWFKHLIFRVFCLFLIVVGARGGLQMRPLNLSMAGSVSGVENAPLVLNTPYSLITTLESNGVKHVNYFSDERCTEIFDTHRHIAGIYSGGPFTNFPKYGKAIDYDHPINIVLIILEGISSEYSSFLADEPKKLAGYTPFLDSLAQNAIVFRGMANGQQSIEALSSILGGIPSLMDKPFSQSRYAVYDIPSAVTQLSEYGMETMFFHGGKNGTMGFDRYCRLVGIDEYFGKDEYPYEGDDDGTWGIKDIPYLQYVAKKLGSYPDPFFATIFTLSSHHPFTAADEYKGSLPTEATPMQRCVAYTDEALRQFFERAKKSYWYENTLFVITADHTNFVGAENVDYNAHRYSVPMIFYWPKNTEAFRSDRIVQQVDIMPTIFDFCKIEGKFTTFGNSAFDDNAPHFAINYLSGIYKFYTDQYLFEFDGQKITQIWDLHDRQKITQIWDIHDRWIAPWALEAWTDVHDYQQREQLMKAVIQKFNNGLLDNNL